MTTHDFTSLSNFGDDPLRGRQLAIASTIDLDQIEVSIVDGPIGGYGFRRGYWPVAYKGETFRPYVSVPADTDFDDQIAKIRHAAALHIAERIARAE